LKLIVTQVIGSLLDQPMDFAKVTKLTADSGFESTDTMAAISCLKHIIFSAAKFDCDEQSLEAELQQLGLPKEHTLTLCRPYKEKKDALRTQFQSKMFRMSSLDKVDWRLDYVISSSNFQDISCPSVELRIEYTDHSEPVALDLRQTKPSARKVAAFTISDDKLRALDHELRAASALMESLE
jgi:COMM domain containing 4